MKKFALVAALFVSLGAQAQKVGDAYGELSYLKTTINDAGTSGKPTGYRLTVGKGISENVALEGFAYGSGSTTIDGTSEKLKTSYGLAIRPFVTVSKDVELFGRVGFSHLAIKTDDSSVSKTKAMYGVGAAYNLNKDVALTVDYTNFGKITQTDGSIKASAVGVGARFKF